MSYKNTDNKCLIVFKYAILISIICCLVHTGCKTNTELHAEKTELILYCGAGIRPAAHALIEAFEQEHKHIIIQGNYAGSGQLLGMISSMQKGDLFMPGAELYADIAIEKGLAVHGTKRIVAYFIPVIFTRKGIPEPVTSLMDLKRDGLRLGFGDERSCAIGKKTLKILEKNNIKYEELEKNIVFKSGTVNELGVAIQLGTVDAVIVWDATARHFADNGTMVPIPLKDNVISPVSLVLLKSSSYPDKAKSFIDFATSEKGRKILIEKGYTATLK